MKRENLIIYEGASLLDGKPIFVMAQFEQSSNTKTGDEIQTWIMRSDINPLEASKTGEDFSICGNCPHRGTATTEANRKQAIGRKCYVKLFQAPLAIWKKHNRKGYKVATPEQIAELSKGRMVRLGSYGDPSAVPSNVWDSLLKNAKAKTGYTHQLTAPKGDELKPTFNPDIRTDHCMVSADSLEQAREAWAHKMRTFRILKDISELIPAKEILCPASKEGGRKTQCARCKLCSGTDSKATKSVAIVMH